LNEPKVADSLAEAAVAPVESGMVIGLGTGRTASRAVLALAERVRDEHLDIRCVSTSHVTDTLARAHQLNLVDFTLMERVDYMFDGAAEVDEQMRMLKGQHGAIVRQRVMARAASKRVFLVDEPKVVKKLGQRSALAIAILPWGLASIRADLRNIGFNGVVRRTLDGGLFFTENAMLILDVMIGDREVEEVADELDGVPGVIDHGLFLDEADEILVGQADGGVRRMVRPRE
jgi:ribose 5-phosphate isomerase A